MLRRGRPWLLTVVVLVCLGMLAPLVSAEAFAHPAFRRLWQRSDQVVADGAATRSWLWGTTPGLTVQEAYAEGAGGTRLVQYFDKGRMELNHPDTGQVTSGLLVRELATGQMQTGDNRFSSRAPALIRVAGDPVANERMLTYADFGFCDPALGHGERARNAVGQPAMSIWLNECGGGGDPKKGTDYPEATYAFYDEVTGVNVPGVFWEFFHQRGVVWEDGRVRANQLLFNWLEVVGHPITNAYWTRCKVNGVERDVLVQLFERRVLTYTPANPAGWRVEMGNVGLHYRMWRYP